MESLTELRVRYAETDAMGIVHHATYPVWMELGRSDFLRELGQSYAEWEARGVRLVVNEIRVKFRAPAYYDELVQVRTFLKEAGRRRVTFGYRVERSGALLAEGESIHLAASSDNRARPLPEDLLALIQGS
ncbi:MAG: acyl-CoA thioesterase [Acidobacteria bacterium]|nr:acyl-CoA thioesterase [Acidobacteriota bacterium]MBI3488195.1 acyl-CoA thioesterase [Acidobacteriota bacterium]